MAAVRSIHTLDARNNIMLQVLRDAFNLDVEGVFQVIQELRVRVDDALAAKGISYDSLKSALVPDQRRREIALVFDRTKIESAWYGFDVFKRVIPLFARPSSHSVLVGDYLDRAGEPDLQFQAFSSAVRRVRDVTYQHPSQFLIVYVNNLSEAMVRRFEDGLRDYVAFVGVADMTYSSTFKVYLSTMLARSFVKHGTIILQGHEPDRAPDENVNVMGYPFADHGYVCRSISEDLMGVLLSYKIERPVFPGLESDTDFALIALGERPTRLASLEVEVEEAKLMYLKTAKAGSMDRAGLQSVTSSALGALIRAKISNNYIYNLRVNEEHTTVLFNIIVEIPGEDGRRPTKLLAALRYHPERQALTLVTLF